MGHGQPAVYDTDWSWGCWRGLQLNVDCQELPRLREMDLRSVVETRSVSLLRADMTAVIERLNQGYIALLGQTSG